VLGSFYDESQDDLTAHLTYIHKSCRKTS